jgi:hypothetical protein
VLSLRINLLVKLFLVINLHVIYFLHLLSTLCTHTCHILCILLLCSAAQKMKSTLMKISSRRAKPPVNCLWQDGVHSAV